MHVYASPRYAETLIEFGTPRFLPNSGGSILERKIPGYSVSDAMGSYPFFACSNWDRLQSDLNALQAGSELISLCLVADPHGDYDHSLLADCFDRVVAFKQHYVVDLATPLDRIGSAERRRKARRALRDVEVEICSDPIGFIDEWCSLYNVLKERHGITGIRAYSSSAFLKQFSLPGVEIIKAKYKGEAVGALVMFQHGDVICGHLCALSELGYRLRATYALDWFSFEHYAGCARCIDLGGGLSLADAGDGLADYKKGWATGTVPVKLCGRIFNNALYETIRSEKGIGDTAYFPAYRDGEYTNTKTADVQA